MSPTHREPVRILHLDDSPWDAELVQMALNMAREQLPSVVRYVQTREQFLEALNCAQFDVILSDWRMPGYTGDDALVDARRICPETPFIMVTGEMGEDRAIETLQRGASDYVLKANMIRLIPAIERALAEADNSRRRREAERERERLLVELEQGRNELWAVIQAMQGGVMVFDMGGTVVLVNDAEAEILGYRHASELKRNIFYFFDTFELYENDGTPVPQEDWPVSHIMRGERIINVELKGRRKDTGGEWFFSFSGQPVRDETGKQILSVLVTRDISERKRTEEALHRASRQTSDILESVADALYGLDKEWRFTYVNPKAEQLLRKTQAELLGKNLWEMFPQAVGTESEGYLRRTMENRLPVHYETRSAVSGDWIEVRLSPKADGGISVMYRDITERKVHEHANRLSEERFSAAFYSSPYPQAISRVDDGVFVDVNSAVLALYGMTREEVIGRSSMEIGILADPAERTAMVQQLARDGYVHDCIMHIRSRTHGERTVSLSAIILNAGGDRTMLSIIQDITEQKRMESALRESEQRFHTLVEAQTDMVAHMSREGKRLYVNQNFLRMVGKTEEEVLNSAYAPEIHPDDAPRIAEEWKKTFEPPYYRSEINARTLTVQGWRWLSWRNTAVFDEKGEPTTAISVGRDITETRQAEAEIRRLNAELEARVRERTAQLERANKELEAFSYSVSHDLRAPLRIIDGYAGLLDRQGGETLSPQHRQYLEVIRQSATQMGDLITGLLEFSRYSSREVHLETVETQALVEEVVLQQRRVLGDDEGERVTVEIGILLPVKADPVLLRQVFANLIGNAFKFTRTTSEPMVRINAQREDGQVIISVSDNGVGFPGGKAERLFQVFQRLHPAGQFEGTGIGLVTVRKIIERHGGWVRAKGEEGKGATFSFMLPLPADTR